MSNSYLTTTVDPTDNKLKRFIRRLHIWWLERKNPVFIGSIWKSRFFKNVDDYILIREVDHETILYFHIDTYMILDGALYCSMKKVDLLRYWERAKWQ